MDNQELQDLSLGDRLRKLRERAGLSQIELGELVGATFRVISYYET
ncbi:helix-turn-helix domain-containing protein, partial [candidate division CSSED10-310 bacterium]